jgi:YbbR domain-containing protein
VRWIRRFQQWPPAQFVIANIGWILISLLLATIIWVVATLEEDPIQERAFAEPIPIRFIEGDDTVHVPDRTVNLTRQVNLRAPRSTWDSIQSDDIEIVADLRGLEPGQHTIELEARIANDDLRGQVVEIIPSDTITVEMEPVQERIVPVETTILGEPSSSYAYSPPVCQPNEVRVRGAESFVQQVDIAVARLNLNEVTETQSFTREVTLVDIGDRTINDERENLNIEPSSVTCQVEVQPREGRLVVDPNVLQETLAEDYLIEAIDTDPEEVFAIGDPEIIAEMEGNIETEPIDLRGQTTTFTRTVNLVGIPPGVTIEQQQVTVTITISPLPGTVQFSDIPIQQRNLAAGLRANLTVHAAAVTVLAPRPALEGFAEEDIVVFVDLADLGEGRFTRPLKAEILREALAEEAEITIQPETIEVTISLTPTETPPPSPTPGDASQQLIVPVLINVVSEPGGDYTYTTPRCTPNSVRVSGTVSQLNRIQTARVDIDLAPHTETLELELDVFVIDEDNNPIENLTIEPPTITCTVDILPVENNDAS